MLPLTIHLPNLPPSNDIPRIANINQIKSTTTKTFTIPLSDSNKAVTIVFKLTLCEINLSGRNTLSNLKILMACMLTPEKDISIKLTQTMKKSNLDHDSER